MSVCVCRFLLAAAILLIALLAWGAVWAKIVIIVGAALLAITSLAYNACCCRTRGGAKAGQGSPPSSPGTAG